MLKHDWAVNSTNHYVTTVQGGRTYSWTITVRGRDVKCANCEMSQHLGVVQPHIYFAIATVLIVPVLFTLLLRTKNAEISKEQQLSSDYCKISLDT